jgi:hypothetical protein
MGFEDKEAGRGWHRASILARKPVDGATRGSTDGDGNPSVRAYATEAIRYWDPRRGAGHSRGFYSEQQFHGGGFARPLGPKKSDEFAGMHRKVHTPERRHLVVVLAHPREASNVAGYRCARCAPYFFKGCRLFSALPLQSVLELVPTPRWHHHGTRPRAPVRIIMRAA